VARCLGCPSCDLTRFPAAWRRLLSQVKPPRSRPATRRNNLDTDQRHPTMGSEERQRSTGEPITYAGSGETRGSSLGNRGTIAGRRVLQPPPESADRLPGRVQQAWGFPPDSSPTGRWKPPTWQVRRPRRAAVVHRRRRGRRGPESVSGSAADLPVAGPGRQRGARPLSRPTGLR
jgi:hypothetical protein